MGMTALRRTTRAHSLVGGFRVNSGVRFSPGGTGGALVSSVTGMATERAARVAAVRRLVSILMVRMRKR